MAESEPKESTKLQNHESKFALQRVALQLQNKVHGSKFAQSNKNDLKKCFKLGSRILLRVRICVGYMCNCCREGWGYTYGGVLVSEYTLACQRRASGTENKTEEFIVIHHLGTLYLRAAFLNLWSAMMGQVVRKQT
jgi:hypothetical protein